MGCLCPFSPLVVAMRSGRSYFKDIIYEYRYYEYESNYVANLHGTRLAPDARER
jgi:hypothetical protein